uniref:small monomeric GTPase n=2 Tax=Macrostomum lignano TaxID=282301 RepID=A0A1I8GEE2_9PLAT
MDPALLRERKKFAKQMAASTESALAAAKQAKAAAAAAAASAASSSAASQNQQHRHQPSFFHQPHQQQQQHHHPQVQGVRFNALSRIIRHMKSRHIEGQRHPLTLEEILEETKQEDLPQSVKIWLGQEALPQNPKLTMQQDGARRAYIFKPIYDFRSGRNGAKDLLKLLKQFDECYGKGAVLKEDIEESLGNADEAIKILGHRVTVLTRTSDKKLWRSCTVQSIDEQQMQQYLSGQGISAADAEKPLGFTPASRSGRRGARAGKKANKAVKLKDNEHVTHMLEDFGDNIMASRSDAADQNFDYMFKLLIIGNSSVGKTSFLFRYADDSFSSAFVSTVGIDFKVKTVFRDDKRVKLQIWDTAGQERYRTITTAYYRGAMGFILMYDVTNEDSFNAVQDWCTQIKTYSWDNAQVVLVGNKCDLDEDRVVSLEFFETSAKDNLNVTDVFERLVDIICER